MAIQGKQIYDPSIIKLQKELIANNKILIEQQMEFIKKSNMSSGKSQKELSKATNILNKEIKKTSQIQKELSQTEKIRLKIKENQKKVLAELALAQTNQNKILQKGKIALQDRNKAIKEEIKLSKTSKGSLVAKRAELKKLTDQYDNASKSARKKLAPAVKKLSLEIEKAEKATNRHQRGVAKYGKALMSTAATFFGAAGLISGIKKGVNTIIDFQKEQSSLQSVSGKTAKQLEGLTKQAVLLGGTTEHTATAITGLQINLAKLGFSVNEIELSTKAILNLSSATGADLAESAKVAGTALRVFGLDASRMQEVTATLAVSTTKSALSFEDFQSILSDAGTVARSYGFTLEDTIALTGKLRDNGFEASKASIALRNILLNLADSNGALAKKLGTTVTNSDELIDSLIKLRDDGVSLNETLELTDKRSVAAFNAFLNSAESARTLRDGITGVNDELQVMVDKKLDNLAGDITKLSSAWEQFVLKGEGGANAFRVIVGFLNDVIIKLSNLDLIFTRSSKLTEEEISRSFDMLMALTEKKALAFQDVIKFADKIMFESVRTQKKGFRKQIEEAGFTAEESLLIWDEYLDRRIQQNEIEIKAAEDALKQKAENEEKARLAKAEIERKTREEFEEKELEMSEKLIELYRQQDELIMEILNTRHEAVLEMSQEESDELSRLIDQDNKKIEDSVNKQIEYTKRKAELEKQIEKEKFDYISDIGFQSFEFVNSLYDREIAKVDEKVKKGTLSEEQGAKKIAEIQRKQAIINKAAALAEIAINTALSVSAIARTGGGTYYADFGISAGVLTALAIAKGVAQAATVIAQPLPAIPSFFEGGKHEGGVAEVHGGEIVKTKEGSFYTNWGKYEGKYLNLPEAEIIPNERVINNDLNQIKNNAISFNGGITEDKMREIMNGTAKQIDNSIKNMPQHIYEGATLVKTRKNNSWITYKDSKY